MVDQEMSVKNILLYQYLLEQIKKSSKITFDNLTKRHIEILRQDYNKWIKRRSLPSSFIKEYKPDYKDGIINSEEEFFNRIKKINVKKLKDFIT